MKPIAFRLIETTRLWRFFLMRIPLALVFCVVFQFDVMGQVKLKDTKVMVDHFYHAYKTKIDSFDNARVLVDPILKSECFVKVIPNTTPQIIDSLIVHQNNFKIRD